MPHSKRAGLRRRPPGNPHPQSTMATINGKSLSEVIISAINAMKADPRLAATAGGAAIGGGYGMLTGEGLTNSLGRGVIGGGIGAAIGSTDFGRDTADSIMNSKVDLHLPRQKDGELEDRWLRGFVQGSKTADLAEIGTNVGAGLANMGHAVTGAIDYVGKGIGNMGQGALNWAKAHPPAKYPQFSGIATSVGNGLQSAGQGVRHFSQGLGNLGQGMAGGLAKTASFEERYTQGLKTADWLHGTPDPREDERRPVYSDRPSPTAAYDNFRASAIGSPQDAGPAHVINTAVPGRPGQRYLSPRKEAPATNTPFNPGQPPPSAGGYSSVGLPVRQQEARDARDNQTQLDDLNMTNKGDEPAQLQGANRNPLTQGGTFPLQTEGTPGTSIATQPPRPLQGAATETSGSPYPDLVGQSAPLPPAAQPPPAPDPQRSSLDRAITPDGTPQLQGSAIASAPKPDKPLPPIAPPTVPNPEKAVKSPRSPSVDVKPQAQPPKAMPAPYTPPKPDPYAPHSTPWDHARGEPTGPVVRTPDYDPAQIVTPGTNFRPVKFPGYEGLTLTKYDKEAPRPLRAADGGYSQHPVFGPDGTPLNRITGKPLGSPSDHDLVETRTRGDGRPGQKLVGTGDGSLTPYPTAGRPDTQPSPSLAGAAMPEAPSAVEDIPPPTARATGSPPPAVDMKGLGERMMPKAPSAVRS